MDRPEIIFYVLNLSAIAGCIAWTGMYMLAVWSVSKAPRLRDVRPAENRKWPVVSVVFAARDEEASVGDTLAALTKTDYPALEIIAVNDRSVDSTGEIIEQYANEDPRMKALHIDTLPKGWMGKVHALDKGYKASSGEWVVFTDADVMMLPDTLGKAITMAENGGHRHLVLFPKLVGSSYMLEVAFIAFSIVFLIGTRTFSIGKKGSSGFIGVGAFNMVRRDVFDASPGFQWLKMEVGDDIGLGLMMRDAGAHSGYAFAEMWVHLTWYENLWQMFDGLSKNMFSTVYYSYWRLIPTVAIMGSLALCPLGGLMPQAWPALKVMSALCLLSTIALGIISRGLIGKRFTPYLLGPLGFALLPMMSVNSALRCWRKGGIEWRGTVYGIDELRKGQRLRF